VLRSAAAAVAALAAERPASAPLRAVGVGVPGVVPPGSGSVRHAVNLGLTDEVFDLGPALAERVGAAVTVENDVNAAALGAAHQLGLPDLALLSIGTGLAAGLVGDGRVRRGSRGAAGEVGHVPVDPLGPPCGCGQRGCLEQLASGSALAAAWPVPGGRSPAVELFAAAAAGDERARRVRDDWSAAVAAAVRLLVLTADVEVVVLGGGVSDVGPPLLEAVSGALAAQATGSAFLTSLDLPRRVVLLPAGSTAAAVGAAIAADLVAAGRA
ncbi:ROK family protein, partial [Angustibacter aerolatus]